ncbi:MAG: hypothetical protein Q9M50_13125 [Methylococcales bacterium]|nr:hypothetical protein [Methylococcales bacterium]
MAAGIILDMIHFPSGENVKVTDIDVSTVFQLGFFYSFFIIIFTIASYWCCSHYDLTHERHAMILKQLADKNFNGNIK